ncbi:MAG TPA: DUF4397 domain-containing protein, partial [Candidatus Limnocylindria bacterium]|nr:DUF4397 domain-containing protein [Candidatus Limnocylindria bacterium]
TLSRLAGMLAGTALVAALAVPVAAADDAMVRVVHASPDAPNVDVWVDGETVLTDVPFTAVSDYLSLPAGTYNIQVTATGDTTPVIEADLAFEAGTAYTVAAYGRLADITAAVFTDDTTVASGQAKLRAIHLSPSAPADVDIAVQGGDVVVPGLAYPEASGYLTLDAGDYPLEIRAAGDTAAALQFDAALAADTNVTAFAMDAEDGVQVITAADATGGAMPDTALAAPVATGASTTVIAGIALLGLAALGAMRVLATRRVTTER